MAITFSCQCGKTLQASEEHAGRLTRCPGCGRELTIPEASPAVVPTAPPPTPSESAPPRRRRAGDEESDEDRRRAGAPTTSGKAVVALVLGLASFCLWFLTGIPALILGFLGLKDINQSGGRLTGKGLAITGLVIAAVNTLILCPAGIGIIYYAYSQISERAGRVKTVNNLRLLGVAMHNYHDSYDHFPSAAKYGPGDQPLFSWRVELLPFVGEEALYREFNRDEPWDSPHNKRLLARMPKVYASPDRPTKEPGMTYFQVLVSPPGTPYDPVLTSPLFGTPPGFPPGFRTCAWDGTSNTIMIAEAADAVPWTKPEDLVYHAKGPLPRFGNPSRVTFLVALADGSVREFQKSISEQSLRSAILPQDSRLRRGPDW